MSSKTLTKPAAQMDVEPCHSLVPERLVLAPAQTPPVLKLVDTLGMAASSLCAIHCMAMPVLIGILPLMGLQILEGPATHRVLALFVSIFALGIIPGFIKHRSMVVLRLMIPGVILVLFATFGVAGSLGETWEVPLLSIGNLLVIAAHWLNRKLSSCSDLCH